MLLKLFLEWIIGYNAAGYAAFPAWKGWAIAAGLGSTGYLMCLVHHQLFWCVCDFSGSEITRTTRDACMSYPDLIGLSGQVESS